MSGPVHPICPYCLKTSDLASKKFFLCRPCDAYLGCHPGTTVALGRLANKDLRGWKMKAHDAFDPLWKSGRMKRGQAYAWMCKALGISRDEAHIGMFSVDQCKTLIKKISELKTPQLPL